MNHITKNIFLQALICPTYGWRLRNGAIISDLSICDIFRMEEGKAVGRRSRELYPDGIFIHGETCEETTAAVQKSLEGATSGTFFEVPFTVGNFHARADIIVKNGTTWDLIEVKSSLKQREEFIDDMAYTTLVARKSGHSPHRICLMLLDRNYRLGMSVENLFQTIDCTEEVNQKVEEFSSLMSDIDRLTSSSSEPEPVLKFDCKRCGQFGQCIGEGHDAHIFLVPKISQKKFEELCSEGVFSIHEIPDHISLTPNQKRFVECVKCRSIHIEDSIHERIQGFERPVYYLDFETMSTALPLYENVAPYEKIPTQYSVHICDTIGTVIDHREYIADPYSYLPRDLAERLIEDLGDSGSVVTYSSFERTIISALQVKYPDLSDQLGSILERIVDLEPCIKCIQHPDFLGRTSIKVVLPVLVSDLSYEDLEISDGNTAMVTFAMAASGMMGAEEWERKRAALLEYCKRDTYAMVKLHKALHTLLEAS